MLIFFYVLLFFNSVSQVWSLCEMGDLWLIRQFEPTNSQYWANWLNICPSQKIPCNGDIMEWNFYSTSDDGSPIFLSVWRQIEPTGYQLIGYNEVNASKVGVVRFPIEREDRIRARAGDVFGVFYEHRDSPGSVAFISGIGSNPRHTSNHVLHSCVSQQYTKDEIMQYMESNGRIQVRGPTHQKLYMVQAVVHDEKEIVRVKATEEPIPSCGPIPQVENAVIVNYQPSGARVNGLMGDTIDFECRETYRMVGPGRVRCNANQKWSEIPQCEATIFCGPPPMVENAIYQPALPKADTGTVVRYTCEHGFSFNQNLPTNGSMIICQDDGTWSTPPMCDRVDSNCGLPPTVAFATAIPLYNTNRKTAVFGDTVRYKCDIGYFLMGNDTITCGRDGRWSDQLPRCGGMYRLCDNKLPEVENAQVVYSSTEPFSVAFYICRSGFFGEGNRAHIRCLPDGTWEKPDYVCGRKTPPIRAPHQGGTNVVGVTQCKNPPPQIANAIVIVRSTEPGAPANYLCLENYQPLGNATVVCGEDGIWRGDPNFSCMDVKTPPTTPVTTPAPITCGDPPQVDHATCWRLYRGRESVEGDIVKYICAEKFQLVGNVTVSCLPNGQWSPSPFCEETEPDCDWPPEVSNAALVSNVDGIEASYECNDGYIKVGGSTSIQCVNGQWTGPQFTCNPLNCGEPPSVRNADWVPKGIASPGTVVIYECNPGTKLSGSDSIVCQSTGEWSTPPDCIEVISCGPPPQITNAAIISSVGMVSPDGLGANSTDPNAISSPGSSVSYSCGNGYQLVQNRSTIYCQNDRKWSEPLPSCEAALYKLEYLAAFWPLSKRYGVRDISGHSFHGAAPILLSFQPAAGIDAPKASIAEFGPNRYVEIRHYRDQFNFAAKSFSFVMYLGPSTVDGPILEYDSVGGRLGFHMWIQASQLYVFYEPKYYLYSGYTGNEIKSPKIDLTRWNFVASVYDFPSGTASLWLDNQKLAEKYVGHLYPEMSQGFYIGQHKRPTGDPRQFQGQQIACVAAYKLALESQDLVELKQLCLRLLAPKESTTQAPRVTPRPDFQGVVVSSGKINNENPALLTSTTSALILSRTTEILLPRDRPRLKSASQDKLLWNPLHSNTNDTDHTFPLENLKDDDGGGVTLASPIVPNETTTSQSKSCGRVPYVSNAMVSDGFSNGSSHVGDSATYRCFTGYVLDGDALIQCLESGMWSKPPTCSDKYGSANSNSLFPASQCSETPTVQHADILFSNRSIGGVSLYRCHHGYALSGSAITYCQSDGVWSELPSCKMVDCGKPPAITNGDVRFDESSFGSQAFYTCKAGYQLKGFQIATCTEAGVWFQIPTCHGSACEPPQPIPNADLVPLRGDGRQPGSAFKIQCKPNYRLADSENDTVTCLNDGKWSPFNQCIEIECDGLPVIPNGIIRPPMLNGDELKVNRAYVRTVTVMCQTGYRLKGPATMTCNGDGTWSEPPECKQFACESPPVVENGVQNYTSTLPGAVVSYSCIPGFKLTGSYELRCSADGRWIGKPPSCREMLCHPPALHPGTSFSYSNDRLIVGTTVSFTCYNGSYLEGNNSAVCLPNGQWSKMGRCLPVSCGLPPAVNNSFIIRLDGYNFSNSVVYSCKDGYAIHGSATVTCMANGQWTETPHCDPPPCQAPQLIDHGSVNFRTPISSGSQAFYDCSPGFELNGSRNITCLPSGEWSNFPPECKPLSCGSPPEIPNSMVTIFCNADLCNVGEKAIYECPPQWHLIGSPVVTCLPDRKWSHIPSCVSKTPRDSGRSSNLFPHVNTGFRKSRFFRTFGAHSRSFDESQQRQPSTSKQEEPNQYHQQQPIIGSNQLYRRSYLQPGLVQSMSLPNGVSNNVDTSSANTMPPFLSGIVQQSNAISESIPNFLNGGEEFSQSESFESAEQHQSIYRNQEYSFENSFTDSPFPWLMSTLIPDIITCGQAPFVPNSLVSFSFVGDGSRPGDTARYACSGNFQMRGPDVAVCLDSGHWSVVPACESPCAMLSLMNGFVTYYNHSVQTVVTETEDMTDFQRMPTYRSLNNLYLDEGNLEDKIQTDFQGEESENQVFKEEKHHTANVSNVETDAVPQSKLEVMTEEGMAEPDALQFEFRYTSSVHEGTVARFGCESSFDLVGPREAICQKDGSWSAPVPKCTACHQMSIGNVPPAIVLNEVAYLMSPNLTLFLDMRFNCSGRLTSWVYYCRSREADQAAGAYLGVWRPTMPSRATVRRNKNWPEKVTEYRLVGKTFVKPRQYGFNVHNLTDREAIEVKFGDIIGFHYAVPAIPARYLTVPIATQRDPWPFDASTLSRTYSQALTDRDIVRDENTVRLRSSNMAILKQTPAIKAVLSPSFVHRR